MKNASDSESTFANSFDRLPRSALSTTTLTICLKCAFDFFVKQLKLAPRTAFMQLKKHTPEEPDLSGAATSRPHFFATPETKKCPYCNAAKRWFAVFTATRIDVYPAFEKARRQLWAALRKEKEAFVLLAPARQPMQLFSEWLERLQQQVDFTDKSWLLAVAVETVKRESPAPDWQEVEACGIRRVQLLRNLDTEWRVAGARLYVSPRLYGNILMVQHLLSRAQQHGGQTFEGRLTLAEFTNRLRRIGYLETLGITTSQPFEIFEQAIVALVASGPTAVYYAIDRRQYLERLQQLYRKNFATSKES